MDNVKCIISGGCSFTAGHELKDFFKDHSPYSWDCLVKNKLFPQSIHIRTALGGLSNPSIARRVIYQVNQNLKKYNPQELFVMIMWSGIGRKEFFLSNKNENPEDDFIKTFPNDFIDEKRSPPEVRKFNNQRRKKFREMRVFDYLKQSYLTESTQARLYYNLKEIEYTKSFLQSNKVNYLFCFAYNDLKNQDCHNVYVKDLIDRLDLSNTAFYIDNMSFNEFTDYNNFPRGTKALHPLESAHVEWANSIINHLS